MQNLETVQEIVRQLNIIDDPLFQKMAEDPGFCEEMIATILGQQVTVKQVVPQNIIKNLQGRSVVLDALCKLENGEECNVEVQKANDDDHQRRLRYNTSCITANITEPGIKFKKVPNVIGIYISKFDMFQSGKTVYHIDRTVRETGEIQDNGLQEIYVNTKIDDGSDVAELMRIFTQANIYDFEKFPKVSERKKQFKSNKGGETEVCDLVENYAKACAEKAAREAAEKAAREATENAEKVVREANEKAEKAEKAATESARKFFESGVDYEVVRNAMPTLDESVLEKIYKEVQKTKE